MKKLVYPLIIIASGLVLGPFLIMYDIRITRSEAWAGRNSSGTYTLPSGNPVVTGTTISSVWANATLSDIKTELTDSLSRSGKGGMTAALRGSDGVAGAPAFSFTSDPTNGLYRASANNVRMAINAADAQTWTTTGTTLPGTLGVTGATTLSAGLTGTTGTFATSLDTPILDHAGTIAIGATNGTTVTLGRSGQTVAAAGTISGPIVRGANGTTAAPTYSFASDTGTGMYRYQAGGTSITSAGADVLLVNASGVAVNNGFGLYPGAATAATLPIVLNGGIVYCSDCTIANPCAGGGSGAIAKRLNATWVCN